MTAYAAQTGTDSAAVHYLAYDTTGVAGSSSVLQAAIDAGNRFIVIPPGVFKCDAAVFYDGEDGNSTLILHSHGVVFKATTGLPTVAEFETYNTNRGFHTGTKWFLFPSTYRDALSGGVVTTTGGHSVIGTATLGGPKSGVHPHLVVEGGTWYARDITNYNAGFCHTNVGGATEIRSMHMNGARMLLGTGSAYVDGNKMFNCSGWEVITTLDATYDMALFYQYGSGDGVEIRGCKTANYIMTAKLLSCNSAILGSSIGGGYYLEGSHGIVIDANHTETANNITSAPRTAVYVRDSHVTYRGGFDYLSNTATDGAIVLDDSGTEGKHSRIDVHGWLPRRFLDPNTSDPVCGMAFRGKVMNIRSEVHFHECWCEVSASDSSFGQAYGPIGLPISFDTADTTTLNAAANLAAARDIIGSGSFKLFKEKSSAFSTGQNQAADLGIAPLGSLGQLYTSVVHVTPTSYNNEGYGATGTLTNGQAYAYAFALCNTLPDGTIQYGQATAERLLTAGAKRAIISEVYLPTAAAQGASLVVWRKTGTGVLATPDAYVIFPVGHASTRIFDTGVNVSGTPWVTTSVPVPNTVAAANHTALGLYVAGTAVTIP